MINDKTFYFKGFGIHEDSYIRGRGSDECLNVKDIGLLHWIGANSFRTSHYPYAEEMYYLCDKEGIIIIDETPAVGLSVMDYVENDGEFNMKRYHAQVLDVILFAKFSFCEEYFLLIWPYLIQHELCNKMSLLLCYH